MIELEKMYKNSKDIKLLLINVDDNKGNSAKSKAGNMLKELGIDHDYLLDPYQRTILKYNPDKSVPATFLVNKRGYIIFKEIGYHKNTMQKLKRAIENLR